MKLLRIVDIIKEQHEFSLMKKWSVLLMLLIIFAYHSNIQASTEPIRVTDLAVMDQNAILEALITNNSDSAQNFVYIIQVKDSNGYTAQLVWMNGSIQPKESLTIKEPLTIEMQNMYNVEIFVWSNITDPIPLSYSHNVFTFDFFPTTSSCKGIGACLKGSLTRIIDGDTLDVDGNRIRLALVDTPEMGEPGFVEAAEFTSNLCPGGSTVLVDQDGKQMYDKYNRMIAVVYCDGALLNAELLFADHAVLMKNFCNVSEFGDEDWAQLFGC